MTTEGVLMIIILCFALIKIIQGKNYFSGVISLKNELFSKSSAETVLFFALSVIACLCITNLIVGLILLNAIVWAVYHVFLKSLRYNYIAWLSLVIFWLYLYASYITFDAIPYTEIWYYTLFSWGISLLFLLLYDTIGKYIKILSSVIVWLISSVILLVPCVFIVYKFSFDVPMETGQLNAIYQTSFNEAAEFAGMYISPVWLIFIAAIIVGTMIVFLLQEFTGKKNIKSGVFFYMTAGLFLLVNLNVLQNLAIPTLIIDSTEIYFKELSAFKEELQKRKVGDVEFNAFKEKGKELYIIVIGESLNKNHMSLYGYHRNTTPQLKKLYQDSAIIKFEEAFSTHTHTIPVLTQALTASNQLNKKSYYSSLSILDILEKADFDTYWLSNQVSYGAWDNPISVLAERADHRFNFNSNIGKVNETVFLDERLVIKLEEILSEDISENTAIFIHLMGNHGDYKNRYTDDYKKYTGELDKKFFGDIKNWTDKINAYDNSILYNDNVVFNIINAVQKKGGISACLYFADHGNDVLGNKGHNSGTFTYSMIQIPMIAWFSDAYKEKYHEKYNILKSHFRQLFSTDLIYDMLIGMTGVSTDHYNTMHDICSDNYYLPIQHCLTLDGARKYTDKENFYYHQRRNTFILDSLGQLSRVFPHRVNTIGKLKNIFYNGNNSFEVDIIYRQGEETGYFEVGHDEGSVSGMKLGELLSYIHNDQLQKIWLDIKNLNDENLPAILQRLTELDRKFNIKEKAIVESSTTSSSFAELAKLGFHTSYYLPTYIKDFDKNMLSIKAAEIARQIQKQQVKAISFDVELYPFVKQNLEKIIQSNIVYHTWDLSLQLKDTKFKDNLMNKNHYIDSRVKSILVKYHSDFEL